MPVFDNLPEFAKQFRSLIDSGKRFLVLTHYNPDGDAYGCTLAMAHSLKELGKEVVLWNDSGVTDRYRFMPGTQWIQSGPPPNGTFDVRIVVDNAHPSRVGKIPLTSDPQSPIINIDHHASNTKYGDYIYIEPNRASCGEIIFDLLQQARMPFTKDAAKCLFVAISTDTGSFQYPSVTPATFRTAAALLDQGLDLGELSRQTYESYPPRRLRLLREVLQSAKFDSEDRIGYFWIDQNSYERSGAKPEDTEGLIDHIRSIHSVWVAILFEEISTNEFRMSFRSKNPNIDVNQIAKLFGGGGHPAAAGARLQAKREELETKVLDAVRQALTKAKK
jgi:bifunctional oligoribonuclease and PAP phosphatase NrnA